MIPLEEVRPYRPIDSVIQGNYKMLHPNGNYIRIIIIIQNCGPNNHIEANIYGPGSPRGNVDGGGGWEYVGHYIFGESHAEPASEHDMVCLRKTINADSG